MALMFTFSRVIEVFDSRYVGWKNGHSNDVCALNRRLGEEFDKLKVNPVFILYNELSILF